jgi:hypothetical protein
MPRYFFDSRDGSALTRDKEGLELTGLPAVKRAATGGLGDWAKDAIVGAEQKDLTIEVRDDAGNQVFRVALHFSSDG